MNGNDAAGTAANAAGTSTGNSALLKIKIPKRSKVKFDVETPELNRHVFQTFGESQDKKQFTKMMEALRRYVNKHCKHAGDMSKLFNFENPTIDPPEDISADEAKMPMKLLKWTENTKNYLQREQPLEDNLKTIHSVIWGQCSLSLQAKIKPEKEYVEKDKANDCAWLLAQIKNAIYKFDSKKDVFYSIVEARATLEFV